MADRWPLGQLSGMLLTMRAKVATLGYIGYLLLLGPYGRTVQGWIEQVMPMQAAPIATLICLIAAAIIGRQTNRSILITTALVATLSCAALYPFILVPVEWSHIVHYAILSILLIVAFDFSYLTALLLASLIGALDEGLQSITPGRVFDLRDVILNLVGAAIGIIMHRIARSNCSFCDRDRC